MCSTRRNESLLPLYRQWPFLHVALASWLALGVAASITVAYTLPAGNLAASPRRFLYPIKPRERKKRQGRIVLANNSGSSLFSSWRRERERRKVVSGRLNWTSDGRYSATIVSKRFTIMTEVFPSFFSCGYCWVMVGDFDICELKKAIPLVISLCSWLCA